MRTLSAPLLAAQRERRRRPYLKVVYSDRVGGIHRFRPEQWYNGSEAAGRAAAACSSDDSLTRLRIDGTTLYFSRVATPSSSDTYSSWTSFRTNTLACALASRVGAANLWAFAIDSVTPTQVYENSSTDHGQTWTGWTLAFTLGSNANHIAASAKSATVLGVVVDQGNNLRAYRRTAGVWDGGVASADGLLTPSGIALHYQGDYNVAVTGAYVAGGASIVATRIFGDGFSQGAGTWSTGYREVARSDTAAITYSSPALLQPDTYRLVFLEVYSGLGPYTRPYHTHTPATADYASNLWKEPAPVATDVGGQPGITSQPALSVNTTHWFLTTSKLVAAQALAVAETDLTAQVVGAHLPETPLRDTRAWVELPAGSYTDSDLLRGSEVDISPGYYDGAAPISSAGASYWIDAFEYDSAPPKPVIRLHLVQVWGLLAAWRAPRSFQFAAGTTNIFNILQFLAARAGLEFSGSGASADSSNLTPAITVPAGRDGLAAVVDLLRRVPDTMFARGEFLFLTEPLSGDSADAAYAFPQGATDHEITSVTVRLGLPQHPHVRVVGGPTGAVVAEAINGFSTSLRYPSPLVIADRELTTAAAAQDRADAVLRQQLLPSDSTRLVAPVHCGLETADTISISDSRTITISTRRVQSIITHYRAGPNAKATYHQQIEAGDN